jgi:hypothetical protein
VPPSTFTVAPPAPLVVVSAVARIVTGAVGGQVAGRVSAGPAPPAWTLDNPTVGRYVQVTSVSGPTPTLRGAGRTGGWTALVQVDLYERATAEDPTVAAALLAAVDGTRTDEQGGARRWKVTLETVDRLDAPTDPGWVRHRLDVRVHLAR